MELDGNLGNGGEELVGKGVENLDLGTLNVHLDQGDRPSDVLQYKAVQVDAIDQDSGVSGHAAAGRVNDAGSQTGGATVQDYGSLLGRDGVAVRPDPGMIRDDDQKFKIRFDSMTNAVGTWLPGL